MRIVWHSNAPMAPTGYGNQTKEFTPRLKAAGHEVTISAFYGVEGARLNYNGITILPRGGHQLGNDVIEAHTIASGAELLISLMDVWVLPTEIMARLPWAAWTPIDHQPAPPQVLERLEVCRWPIAMSQFGLQMMRKAGLERAAYVPHGVDTGIFHPMDRSEARVNLARVINARSERERLHEDTFLAIMVAANKGWPSRKSFAEVLEAWGRFARQHTNSLLYLHTDALGSDGVNFGQLMEAVGCDPETVAFAPIYDYTTGGINAAYLNDVYNAADVLVNPSMGEGFGIPIVEAQAAGCPVIVGDWTSMPELCFGGWRVQGARWLTPMFAYQWIPSVGEIAMALERAYERRGDQALRDRARLGAEQYDAETVMARHWMPLLERIEREITRNKAAATAGQAVAAAAADAEDTGEREAAHTLPSPPAPLPDGEGREEMTRLTLVQDEPLPAA